MNEMSELTQIQEAYSVRLNGSEGEGIYILKSYAIRAYTGL